MGLSPDDIVNYPLKQAVRGYSVPQVDELLDQVADTVERLTTENEDLRRRLRHAEDRLAAASETESTLKRTLVTAQRAAEQSLEEAREQAAALVEDARRESGAIMEEALLDAEELRVEALRSARAEEAEIRRRRQALEGHIEALRIFEREYRARLRGHLEGQLRMLEEVQHAPAGADVPQLEDVEVGPPDEQTLRVRVRDGLEAEVDSDGHEDLHDDRHDDGPDDAGEVGSGPSREPPATDDVRSGRRRSVP